MRIATMILALVLMMIILLQTALGGLAGSLADDQSMTNGAAVGFLLFLLYLLGAAFAIGLPRVSVAMFAIAAIAGFAGGSSTAYHDLTVWGGVAVVLGIMAWFGAREKRRKRISADRFA